MDNLTLNEIIRLSKIAVNNSAKVGQNFEVFKKDFDSLKIKADSLVNSQIIISKQLTEIKRLIDELQTVK